MIKTRKLPISIWAYMIYELTYILFWIISPKLCTGSINNILCHNFSCCSFLDWIYVYSSLSASWWKCSSSIYNNKYSCYICYCTYLKSSKSRHSPSPQKMYLLGASLTKHGQLLDFLPIISSCAHSRHHHYLHMLRNQRQENIGVSQKWNHKGLTAI